MRTWNYYLEVGLFFFFDLICIFRLYMTCVYIPDDIEPPSVFAGEFF